jgi:hypothetical protein
LESTVTTVSKLWYGAAISVDVGSIYLVEGVDGAEMVPHKLRRNYSHTLASTYLLSSSMYILKLEEQSANRVDGHVGQTTVGWKGGSH